jgi:hypothetical protein
MEAATAAETPSPRGAWGATGGANLNTAAAAFNLTAPGWRLPPGAPAGRSAATVGAGGRGGATAAPPSGAPLGDSEHSKTVRQWAHQASWSDSGFAGTASDGGVQEASARACGAGKRVAGSAAAGRGPPAATTAGAAGAARAAAAAPALIGAGAARFRSSGSGGAM